MSDFLRLARAWGLDIKPGDELSGAVTSVLAEAMRRVDAAIARLDEHTAPTVDLAQVVTPPEFAVGDHVISIGLRDFIITAVEWDADFERWRYFDGCTPPCGYGVNELNRYGEPT